MIKNHWPAVLISIALGFLMVLPFFYFQITLGEQYKGILPEIIDDELFYMARIKEITDGHPTLGNVYLLEHKNQLPQQSFLPEFLLAQPLKFLNLNIVQGRMFYNFILPAFVFILTYLIFYLIYPSRFWANIFAVFLIFGLYLFKFTRPVIPQFVFLFWLVQFIFLWQLLKKSSSKRLILLNILNFGLLFYLYPFYWTFYSVFLAILTVVYFFRDKLLSKQFLKILIGGAIIGSFYLYLVFLAAQIPEYQETLTRLQLVFSRSPSEVKSVFLSLLVLVLIGILYRLKTIKINREILFFIAGIISIVLVTNQNIITGQKFEFGHYRMPSVFFLVFALYYLFSKIRISPKYKIGAVIVLILISINGTFSYTQRVFGIFSEGAYIQRYAEIFNWLNENTLPDSVVYANEEISELIPVYTFNNVFYSRYANLFIISDEEVEERFILNNFFSAQGGSAPDGEKFDRDFVIENERAIWGVRYADRYGDAVQANKWRRILNLRLKDETRLPEDEIKRVLTKAGEIWNTPLDRSLKKYRIDYFIWDKNKNPNWEPGKLNLKPIYNSEDIYVFEI